MNSVAIPVSPIISEKSMHDAKRGKFTFRVSRDVDKETVKRTVEEKFNVHVTMVSTSLLKGRTKRVGSFRKVVRESSWKKAVVTVLQGEKIDLFDVGGKQ